MVVRAWALAFASLFLFVALPFGQSAAPIGSLDLLDPLEPGPFGWERLEYDFGHTVVFGEPAHPYVTHLRGSVHVPVDAAPAKLLVFMHGRHATCATLLGETLVPQCTKTPATHPVPSFAGYDHMATLLASHGYAVVSVDANHINDVDLVSLDAGGRARGELILRTLDAIEERNATEVDPDDGIGDRLVGRLDLTRVGLMGHSRGGEGVVQAAVQDEALGGPYHIEAVFALAPIDAMGSRIGTDAFAVLLPYCDGDVFDLSGARIYDASRALPGGADKHQFLFLGANHNWFNTEWRHDDATNGDAFCHGGSADRLTMQEQRDLGSAYITAFLRTYIGDEDGFMPYLTGATALTGDLCPLVTLPRTCAEEVLVSHHPADRLMVKAGAGAPGENDLGGTVTIATEGSATMYRCTASRCPLSPTRGSADQLAIGQFGGATYRAVFPAQDVAAFDAFGFRATFGGTVPPHVEVTLEDVQGNRSTAVVSSEALLVPPGTFGKDHVLNTVRSPMASFSGVDPTQVVALEIAFSLQSGAWVQIADLMFHGPH